MIVQAKDAEAGRRYRVLDSGDIIEVLARPSDARVGKMVPLTTRDGSFVHVNAVTRNGRRLKEADPSAPLVIPAFFKLEPFDGVYAKAPVRRAPPPRVQAPPKNGGPGRRTKGDTPWRGWAVAVRHDMEGLLEVVESEGFWLAETFHYFRVGFRAETCMGVFKAGQLGFHERPDGPLGEFPAKKPTTDPYLPWKVELCSVMSAERWEEMLDMLRRHLREFKRRVERSSRARK